MARQRWRPTLAIILLGLVLESRSIEKHWLGRLNWTDPKNWLGGLVPVNGSRLVFPTEMRHAVGMPRDGDLEIVGMELPRDGFLALPENGRLKVEGHCCHYCGGRVGLSGKSLASRARRAAAAALARHADGIVWHSRPTWDGHGEILLAERGRYEGVLSAVAVAELEARLREEGLDLLYSETSGGPLYDYRLAVALGPLLGGFFALLLLLLLLFPAFGYSYSQVWEAGREVVAAIRPEHRSNERRKRKSFAFARFENVQEGSVHLAERGDTETRLPVRGETFENPLFGSGEPREGAMSALERCLDPSEAISFAALEEANELDRMESIELEVGTR